MSCKIYPQIKDLDGNLIDSELYKQLLSYTKDRDLTNIIYAMVNDPNLNTVNIDDSMLEPSIEDVIKNFNLLEVVEILVKLDNLNKQLGGDQVHKQPNDLIKRTMLFNDNNPSFAGLVSKDVAGYRTRVEVRNDVNALEVRNLKAKLLLNNKIIALAKSIGINVDTNWESIYAHGVFDPLNAEMTADGLLTLIRITNNQKGLDALPEEWAHFAIDAFSTDPLVRRLLSLLNSTEVIKEVLGDQYDKYVEYYNNNIVDLAREAAGKLVAQHIVGEVTVVKTPLLERIWQRIKLTFSKMKESDVELAIKEANKLAKEFSITTMDSELIKGADIARAMQSTALYNLNKEQRTLNRLTEVTNTIIKNSKKLILIYQHRRKGTEFTQQEKIRIAKLELLIANNQHVKGITSFLDNVTTLINHNAESIASLYDELGNISLGDPAKLPATARLLKNIQGFIAAYKEPVSLTLQLKALVDRGEIDIDAESLQVIMNSANHILGTIHSIENDYIDLARAVLYNTLLPIWGDSKIVEVGKHKGKEIKLMDLIKGAEKDLNIINRFLDSAADSSDALIGMLDVLIKDAQWETKTITEEVLKQVRIMHNDLLNTGIKDTAFMFDMNGDTPTGYLVSDIDHAAYDKAELNFLNSLEDSNISEKAKERAKAKWYKLNRELVTISKYSTSKEYRPKQSKYPSQALSKLSDSQRAYYDKYILMKIELDALIPNSVSYTYKAVQLRNEALQAALDKEGLSEKVKGVASTIADKVIRREDDTEFGDINTIITDFNNREVKRLPIHYTNMLQDMTRLNIDASSSIISYALMAAQYQAFNKIVSTLELASDVMRARKVTQHTGNKVLKSKIGLFADAVYEDFTKSGDGTLIMLRYDDMLDMLVYNKMKMDHGTFSIGDVEIDKAKLADTVAHLTSVSTLGLNFFSSINNVAVGKYQLMLETAGKEYFSFQDATKADLQYFKLLPAFIGEVGQSKLTSKLGLISEKFDVFQDFDKDAKNQDFYKSTTQRVFGKGSIFFLQSAGEHYMQTKTLLAMMTSYKVLVNNKEVSLIDAYTTKNIISNGQIVGAELVLPEGTTKLDGTEFTNEDIKTISRRTAKINQSLHGIYNNADKSAILKHALGRLAIMFRKWMVPHYNRRFKGAYYDLQLDQWREGFHVTSNRFIINMLQELKQGKFNVLTNYKELHPTELANIKRAMTEVGAFFSLSILLYLLGNWKDKDTWASRVMQYLLRRLHLEMGTSFFAPMMVTEGMTLLQSPSASMKTFNVLIETANVFDLNTEIDRGKYKGHSVYYRNLQQNLPIWGNILKVLDIKDDDALFNIFK